jgi:YVTN family beta-propeller protein
MLQRALASSFALTVIGAARVFAAEPTAVPAKTPPAAADASNARESYAITGRYAVGGDGGWDYVVCDAPSRRIFLSHATHVVVLDTDSGKLVGDIPGTEGVHGIALAPELKRGFTSNGRANTVSVFDLAGLKVTSTVKTTGENPDAILFDPATKRVFTFNGRGQNATAIDADSLTVAGTIPLGGKPEFARSDKKGRVFVNIEDKNEVAVIDARKLSVEARWPVAPCEEPGGMAIDAKSRRLFVGCGNKLLMVMSADDGKVLAKLPIGEGNDAVGFDEETGLVFASNGDGTLTVVQKTGPDAYTVKETVTTERGARTLAIDAKTHRVFLPTAKFGPPPSPTAEQPRPRRSIVPGSFEVLVVAQR